jgi:pimeloyl-ACP methyl ester carboxylesterase
MMMHKVSDGTDFQMNYEVKENMVPEDTLFIHGNLASNRWWYPAETYWKKSYTGQNLKGALIYAEFRGAGKSSPPKSESEVTMSRMADDYISLVKSLGRGPMHLVGHSTGGLIVAMMMAKAPELFKKAVLLDPVGAKGVTFDNSMIQAFEQMKADKNLTAVVIGSTIYNNDANSDYFKQVLVEDAYTGVKNVGHYVLKALDGLNVMSELKNVKNETLVLHGEHDQLLPVADSRAYTDILKNARFQQIAGQGHCTNVENPELFVKTVKDFLF